ncbi:CDP-alcohol phosphatidyltransferase family protein [Sphingobacterium sp. SYP-B4668]|uniref:CDP-alcohol phosphatidyltransferase family protein n=1 Tax=Sphingobacterium sp. SYP-B4668 TaxID=2996035 RepID=UPI0022DD86F6|nr:CDP-alcohol phosphatidyltransferase family protein [Sphingobacterium sp. SYP-B4668]
MSEFKINKKLFQDRKRTNILSSPEQKLITYLVPKVPSWISSDMLTGIGTFGSALVLVAFILARFVSVEYLLIGVLGFVINWFGDSLDGRLAFYRNKSRRWYGFSLDIIMDWISTVLIGFGYIIYAKGIFEVIGYVLVACYGWSMIISQLRYKVTDKYTIDAGIVGPTEIRVIISLVLVLEVVFPGVINYLVAAICAILFFINIKDTGLLLKMGDERDEEEKAAKREQELRKRVD